MTYDYSSRYLFEFNFGYNGSERLASGERFEFFPAASVGWVVSSEKFWEPMSKYVDHLKLRASYGLVGSDEFNGSAPHFLYGVVGVHIPAMVVVDVEVDPFPSDIEGG